MFFKKYVKYTSLGLALSISAITFAPSMSSAQENFDNINKSVVKKSDRVNSLGYGWGHSTSSKGKYYFYFAGLKAYTDDTSFIEKYDRYQDEIKKYVNKHWVEITNRSVKFGLDIAAAGNNPERILDVIYNFVESLPYSEDFAHALKKIGQKYAESKK